MSTPPRAPRRARPAEAAEDNLVNSDEPGGGSAVTGGHVARGPAVAGTVVGGPAVGGPAVGGPAVGGPAVGGPAVGGPAVGGPVVGGRARGQILDEIDRRVIKILQEDGRRPNTEIARDLHVSETTIRKRVSQLVSQGLINIVAVPTPRAVGLNLSAIIGISVTLPKLKEISEELKRQREVRYVGLSTGRYDIIVEAFFVDQQHFLDFISIDVVKFSYEWEIA